MKFSKLTVAIAATLGASASFSALAMDLYVDTKTKQIYAEPGKGRELMGAFERISDKPLIAPATTADVVELASVKEDLATKTNEIKSLQEHMDEAEKVKFKMDNKGLQAESADKNFKFKLGGRIQTDANYSSNENYVKDYGNAATAVKAPYGNEANDGTEVRRARMEFMGTFYKDYNFKTSVDFADNAVSVKDLFVEYTGLNYMAITLGQQKQNFSQELLESSNDLMFTERSLMNVLNAPLVDRAIGINFQSTAKTGYTAALGVFGNSITPARTTDHTIADTGASATTLNRDDYKKNPEVADAADEGWSVSGRTTYAPIEEKTKVVHLGIAGNYRQADANGDVGTASKSLKFEYETDHMSNLMLVENYVFDVDSMSSLGLENSYLYGPFSVNAEYTHLWIDRSQKGRALGGINGEKASGASDLSMQAWYVDAAWTMTGESRKYKMGKFYQVEPTKKFSLKNGGWGAFELATRYSAVDMDSEERSTGYAGKGGKVSNVTVGLNWYLNSNIRFMADYVRAFDITNPNVQTKTGGDPDANNTFTVRAQLAY